MEDTELLQQILTELKTMNENFSSYYTYVSDRDISLAQEREQEKELERLTQEEQAQSEETTAVNPYDEQLSNIQTVLSSVDESLKTVSNTETIDYTEKIQAMQTTQENIEYNTNYAVLLGFVVIAVLGVLAGFIFARNFFRKI